MMILLLFMRTQGRKIRCGLNELTVIARRISLSWLNRRKNMSRRLELNVSNQSTARKSTEYIPGTSVDNVFRDTKGRELPLVVQKDMQIIRQAWADTAEQEQEQEITDAALFKESATTMFNFRFRKSFIVSSMADTQENVTTETANHTTDLNLPPTVKNSSKSGLTHSLTIKLDEKNFLLWSQQVNGVITAHNLHRFVVNPQIPLQFASVADRLDGKNFDEYQQWLSKINLSLLGFFPPSPMVFFLEF
ncbi:retrovirus-related pol polyprotein from transposon TNT 1-94 [Trifolium medium]|uniref:Retrovirus-related pol polyprotein from transposon TNT 1-94 n=1 Tax=Trifolium medium TaxID=97028 RepID=A0A392MBL7_9FABA|nr:retrovirus-related pol polyprotein from transposon TNT 1-94 [Trifolium medium]